MSVWNFILAKLTQTETDMEWSARWSGTSLQDLCVWIEYRADRLQEVDGFDHGDWFLQLLKILNSMVLDIFQML